MLFVLSIDLLLWVFWLWVDTDLHKHCDMQSGDRVKTVNEHQPPHNQQSGPDVDWMYDSWKQSPVERKGKLSMEMSNYSRYVTVHKE